MPEIKKKFPNRNWVITIGKLIHLYFLIVNTLIEDKFAQWVADSLKMREKKIVNMKRLDVVATPYFTDLFKNAGTSSRK